MGHRLLTASAIGLFFVICALMIGAMADYTQRVNAEFAPPQIQNNWGPYTPWTPMESYRTPPPSCRVSTVVILQRHGARFPTKGAGEDIERVLRKLQSTSLYTDPAYDFLKDFTYNLGTDDLLPFGAAQSFEAGEAAFDRYRGIVSSANPPFVRASSSQRVVDSASNWTAGFATASDYAISPVLDVILSQSVRTLYTLTGFSAYSTTTSNQDNSTLHRLCPNAGDSTPETDAWTAIYAPPIADRINSKAIGANITAQDISDFIPICPFETVFEEKLSPFCNLFTPRDFADWEYYADLDKYYGTGHGQPLGPVQGVGWVNELISRLTREPVLQGTQVNATLSTNTATFPLNRTMYVDFTHDNLMIAIFSAMGLFKQPQPLDPTNPDPKRTWVVSKMIPFSARMIVEKLACGDQANGKAGDFVRILVNEVVQPLPFCGGSEAGLCSLDDFVKSQGYARSNGGGDFERCWS